MTTLLAEIEGVRMSDTANNRDRAGLRVVLLEVAYGLYARRVYTLCLRLVANARVAEEVTIQVFARLGRELTRRWDEAHVLRRLVELAVDEALRWLRARPQEHSTTKRANGSSQYAADFDEPAAERSGGRSKAAAGKFDFSKLDALTARLPDDLRVVFVLRDREGLGDRAVATHLQIGEADARRLLHQARMEIRRMFITTRTYEEGSG